jgi:hypothetical protein
MANRFLKKILAAMQEAEEIGGPEGLEYIELMDVVSVEAQRRARTAEKAFVFSPEDIALMEAWPS